MIEGVLDKKVVVEKNKEMINPEIEQLREPMEKIISDMSDSIESASYHSIIGDDSSGRVPALIFHKFLSKIYESKGLNNPQILFIAGSGSSEAEDRLGTFDSDRVDKKEKKEEIKNHLKQYLKDKEGRILIFTEYIQTGNSLKPLANALEEEDLRFDIATISVNSPKTVEFAERSLGKIYWGEITYKPPAIYNEPDLSGVLKSKRQVLAHPARHEGLGSQYRLEKARKDVNTLSNQLIDWYNQKNNS